ncbi:hypothetical protein [Paenibacillus wynnii]|uniref:hypothetical protein n=1 Tax=Paenibacillus wynnii TaxID=268407 RepID=UPI002790FF75|nr:hypothetical protein [Paenibacillus wynnii]MDQ0192502.1 ATP-dependent Clp protease protease subunit [Paenibacillus wynnii]
MILEMKLAKLMMENENGMNHLWIQIVRDEAAVPQKSKMHLQLPSGISRSYNLNGYTEDERQQIFLDAKDEEVMIEIFTQDAVPCREVSIGVTLISGETSLSKEILVQLVSEDEMDHVVIDERVVERIKELGISSTISTGKDGDFVYIKPRYWVTRMNEYSYLEKEYRVEGNGVYGECKS